MGSIDLGFEPGTSLIVTGAGSGIGRAIALRAGALGLQVSAWDLDRTSLASLREEFADQGRDLHTWLGDVHDQSCVDAGMASAVQACGQIALLHNNAGPPSSAELAFDAALVACVGSVRRVTEAWAAAGPGDSAAMVVTASVSGNILGTTPDWYAAAKAGLAGYVRHLAVNRVGEFRSNAVAPGLTDTPRVAGLASSPAGRRILQRVPMHRMARPDELAWAVLFLLSPLANFVNGVLLPVDGGWTVTP